MRSTPWVDGCCGPHVEDHRVVDVGPRPAGEHELAGTGLTGEGAHLLRALVGLRLEALLLDGLQVHDFEIDGLGHRGLGSPLKVTGTARGGIVLAQRVAHPVIGHEDAGEVGMTGELDAEEVEDLTLGEVHPGVEVGDARHRGVAVRHLGDRPDAAVARVRQEVGHDFVALGGDPRRNRACTVDEVVHRGHVDALAELLLVAQVPREVVPHGALDVDDRLTVRLDEHGAGELLDDHRRDLVARDRRPGVGRVDFVIFFTSLGVGVGHLGARVPQTPDGTPSRWAISIAAPPLVEAARRRRISPFWICSCRVRMPCMRVSGPGGHPGT